MTFYALSSGSGISGISVIRVSGTETKNVILSLTNGPLPKPRVATVKKINKINTNELIDEGIIIWFPGPQSYTGEDMAEFHVHGSRSVVEAIHQSISKIKNCRLAEPGEFTKTAFQNGKINLLKAESIGDLIASETEIQRKQAIKIMSGKHSKIYNSWRDSLIKVLANIEAKIDFPDENLPDNILNDIKTKTNKVKIEIAKVLEDQNVGERIREGFKVAIVGPSNAGKSSLLNYLSRREVAIVSETAGTTRDVIETHLNLSGLPVVLSDTAGIRESEDEIEKKGIRLALKKAEKADLNIVVIEPKNAHFTGFLKDLITDKSILVINKSDLGIDQLLDEFKKFNPIYISIKKEKNLDKLINTIKDKLKNQFINHENILITRERHREHLEKCISYLNEFLEKNNSKDYDLAAEDLRLATKHLGIIVGKIDVEEVLGSIFRDFCIGK
tara:strand:- start:6667 stop:7998 length:1332 start_codon:yes stop_codon:yes gene_type:complete